MTRPIPTDAMVTKVATNPLIPPTKLLHVNTYPSISPSLPALSQEKRTIIITGGHTSLGRATVLAFAAAGASRIIMLGGSQAHALEKTFEKVSIQFPKCIVQWYSINVSRAGEVQDAVDRISQGQGSDLRWDCLVLCHEEESEGEDGMRIQRDKSGESEKHDEEVANNRYGLRGDDEKWWRVFEINVKGSFLIVRTLLPNRNKGASILGTAARVACPTGFTSMGGQSAHLSSRTALVKLLQVVAIEHPDVFVASFCPGCRLTASSFTSSSLLSADGDGVVDGSRNENLLGHVTPELGAHFAVWLCSADARFLRGGFACANWDVDELMEKKRIEKELDSEMQMGLLEDEETDGDASGGVNI